jgi:hypothetical protein
MTRLIRKFTPHAHQTQWAELGFSIVLDPMRTHIYKLSLRYINVMYVCMLFFLLLTIKRQMSDGGFGGKLRFYVFHIATENQIFGISQRNGKNQ